MSRLSVAEKYRQPEVVDFWRQFSAQGLQACEEAMLARYAPAAGDVLDLGCGSGRAGLALEPRGYRVTGLDLSWAMLQSAGDLQRARRLEPRLLQADLRAIPCAGAGYDLALALIAALQHVPGQR
jgi:SAM-dependent methyltransferase